MNNYEIFLEGGASVVLKADTMEAALLFYRSTRQDKIICIYDVSFWDPDYLKRRALLLSLMERQTAAMLRQDARIRQIKKKGKAGGSVAPGFWEG